MVDLETFSSRVETGYHVLSIPQHSSSIIRAFLLSSSRIQMYSTVYTFRKRVTRRLERNFWNVKYAICILFKRKLVSRRFLRRRKENIILLNLQHASSTIPAFLLISRVEKRTLDYRIRLHFFFSRKKILECRVKNT